MKNELKKFQKEMEKFETSMKEVSKRLNIPLKELIYIPPKK